jgi:hypothetical protein
VTWYRLPDLREEVEDSRGKESLPMNFFWSAWEKDFRIFEEAKKCQKQERGNRLLKKDFEKKTMEVKENRE